MPSLLSRNQDGLLLLDKSRALKTLMRRRDHLVKMASKLTSNAPSYPFITDEIHALGWVLGIAQKEVNSFKGKRKKCDPEIWQSGECVFIGSNSLHNEINEWVVQIAERSAQRVDWYFVNGHPVVKAIGDIDKVKQVIQILMPEYRRILEKKIAG